MMTRWSFIVLSTLAVAMPAAAQSAGSFGIVNAQYGPPRTVIRDAYDTGYREGSREGDLDARRGRAINFERDPIYRDGLRGYERRFGSRDIYREDFRRGFVDGYRTSYSRLVSPARSASIYQAAPVPLYQPPAAVYQQPSYGVYQQPTGPGVFAPQAAPGAYQEPAFARGYSDGFKQGMNDGRGRHAYNAINHGDYRDGDNGYYRSYGPRDAYKNNYRSGYRSGYEEGYRNGTGRR
jgi:hypothetical protein